MGTRARIGIQLKNDSVLSVYHHWDGYPEWLGRILTTHYNSRSLAAELIDGGDMSCCWTDERWDDTGVTGVYGPQYYSQRGEDCPPRLDNSVEEFLNDGEEYAYIWDGDQWHCYDTKSWSDTYKELIEIPKGGIDGMTNLYCDITLSQDELTALISCIQLTEEEKRERIESLCGDVKLAGLQTKLAEAVQSNIDFLKQFEDEETTETTEESD